MATLSENFNAKTKYPRLNPKYQALTYLKSRSPKSTAKKIHQTLLTIPSYDPFDPNYKKLVYVRYADD